MRDILIILIVLIIRSIWEFLDGERYINYFTSNTIYNPPSLNITNNFDLAEKLIPLFYFDWSNQKKFFENENYSNQEEFCLPPISMTIIVMVLNYLVLCMRI